MAKLTPQDVKYLSFEGGGGKGAAYLGALEAFKDPEIDIMTPWDHNTHILNYSKIKGIAGASAGSIVAAALAMGVSLEKLSDLFKSPDKLMGIYDTHDKSKLLIPIPQTTGYYSKPFREFNRTKNRLFDGKLISAQLTLPISDLSVILELIDEIGLLNKLGSPARLGLHNLINIQGVHSGKGIINILRSVFDSSVYLAQFNIHIETENRGSVLLKPSEYTFSNLLLATGGLELVITGRKLEEPGVPKYFSYRTTPNLRVIDAVRISACLPFVFAPFRITADDFGSDETSRFTEQEKEFLIGTWVDGGLSNNNPLHVFDFSMDDSPNEHKLGELNPNILALLLQDEPSNVNSDSIVDYIDVISGALMKNTSMLQFHNQEEQDQSIDLPVGKLSTFNFIPQPSHLQSAISAAKKSIYTYFELPHE